MIQILHYPHDFMSLKKIMLSLRREGNESQPSRTLQSQQLME